MATRTPLLSTKPQSLSVCSKLMRVGQIITVPAGAVGAKERRLVARGKIAVRSSNKPGHVQVTCLRT